LLIEAKLRNAFTVKVTVVPSCFIAVTNDILSTKALAAAACHLAFSVGIALLVALEEMRALIIMAAA